MQPPARYLSASALAFLALLTVLAAAPAGASAESGDAAGPETVTTVLQPGWNMVGWLGPEAPATAVFEAIPALQRVSAWDAVHQRYQSRTRTTLPRHALRSLQPGMGLWLRLGGDEPFEWTRPLVAGGVLVSLHAGRNLVGWAGSDGTGIEEAFERFGTSVVTASQWDAESQGYHHYRPDTQHPRNTFVELGRGDGLWVEVTTDARWWQSGAPGVKFSFPDSVPAERRAAIRDDMASVVTFFAERYAIKPPRFSVTVDFDLDIFAGAGAREIRISKRALDYTYLGATLAHEYFHIHQRQLGEYSAHDPSPRWMTEGSATYAGGLYRQERWGTPAEELRLSRLRESFPVTEQLDELALSRLFYAGRGPAYSLGALGVEWLSGHAAAGSPDAYDPTAPGWSDELPDHGTYINYYAALSSTRDWKVAFETAFGLPPEDFYQEFESYRSALTASRFPHLGDDAEQPLLVLVGDVPAETEAAVRSAFEDVLAFFSDRFGAGPADYTVYAAGDSQSAVGAYERAFGRTPQENFCSRASGSTPILIVIDLSCRTDEPHYLDRYHLTYTVVRLAPWSSLPPAEDGIEARGPWWLRRAIQSYIEHAYEATSAGVTFEGIRDGQALLARGAGVPVATLEVADDAVTVGHRGARALAFLAGARLSEHAGEAALLDYYRRLPSSTSWQDAFETAFGVSVADFLEAFESYRVEVAPPLPHLTDDRDEPVLVLVGEMPPETEAVVRARFATILDLYESRLAASGADYTVYVGADESSLAGVYLATTGNEMPERFCSTASEGRFLIAAADCIESSPRLLHRQHSNSVRATLAPLGSIPPADEGHDRRRALWLLLAIEAYAEDLVESSIGSRTLDEIRDEQLRDARLVSVPLGSLIGWDEVNAAGFWRVRDLSSIVGALLAERAGEAALYDYLRQLPSSASWQEAFDAAFGMSVDAFLAEFESRRSEVAPPWPHLADESHEPVLVFVGEVPPATQAALRTWFATMLGLYETRLAAGTADYTVYIGADAASIADIHRLTTGRGIPRDFCRTAGVGLFLIATVDCVEYSPRVLLLQHSESIRNHLAPLGELPPPEADHHRRGPQWLLLAIEAHATYLGESAFGFPRSDEARASQVWVASRVGEPLSALTSRDAVLEVGFWDVRALSSIAGELLAERSGDAAFFDYFRQLPSSASWREAFEAAFGMSVEDFYQEFESYRAEVAPPRPYRIRGVVVDPAGNPSSGAWVAANRGEGRWEDTTRTGDDGSFQLAVRDGRHYLNVDLTTTGCVVPTDDRLHSGGLFEVDGADVTDVEIRLPEGSSCTRS